MVEISHRQPDDSHSLNLPGRASITSYSGSRSRDDSMSVRTPNSNSLLSLLAGSEDEQSSQGDEQQGSNMQQQKKTDAVAYGGVHNKNALTKLQEEISYAVESINTHYFVDLGGVFYYDINFVGRQGFPLKIAATKGSDKFVKLMLENKMIDINKQDEKGLNAFWIAAKHGHGEVMRVLAEHGIEIYNADEGGNNALHLCARVQDRFNVFDMLVKSDYDLNLVNDKGDTAAHIAAQKGNLKHLKALVNYGADINARNNHMLSPLYLSILNEQQDCIDYLLESGAQVFQEGTDDEMDRSPIFLAIRVEQKETLTSIYDQLEPDEAMRIKNSQGLTPVMFAAKNNYLEALNVLVLLDNNSINEEDKNAMTILMHVLLAEEFKPKLAKRLIRRGADPNHIDRNGNPILVKLAQIKQKKLCKFLLDQRASLQHLCDEEGKDACDYAKENGLAEAIPQFMDCSAKKKKHDMAKKMEMDKSQNLNQSFKNRRGVSQYVKRNSVQQTNASKETAGNDAIDDYFQRMAAENSHRSPQSAAKFSPKKGLVANGSDSSLPVSPQKIVTKVVHKADPKVQEVMKKQLADMESRHKATIETVMKQMQDQQHKREKEIQLVIEEKQRQIELIQKSEQERAQIKDQLQEMFLEERTNQSKEIKDFLGAFQQQREATAARMAQMSAEYRAELEQQKLDAKKVYEQDQSTHKQTIETQTVRKSPKIAQEAEETKVEIASPEVQQQPLVPDQVPKLISTPVQEDAVRSKSSIHQQTSIEQQPKKAAQLKQARTIIERRKQQAKKPLEEQKAIPEAAWEKSALTQSHQSFLAGDGLSKQESMAASLINPQKKALAPLQDVPRPPSAAESQKSHTQRILEAEKVPNKKVLAPLNPTTQAQNSMPFDSQSDDEPPSYIDLVMNMKAKENTTKTKKRPIRVLNDGTVVGVDLEDGETGLAAGAFSGGRHSRASLITVEDENGLPKHKIRRVIKKKKKKVPVGDRQPDEALDPRGSY